MPTTLGTTKPGLQAVANAANASPYTPIGYINGTPIYAVLGGRRGGGIQVVAAADDGSSDGHLFDRDSRDDDDGDDDEDDDESDEDLDDDDEDDDEPRGQRRGDRRQQAPDDGWTPPTRDEFERVEGALKRANGEAAKRRTVGKAMKRLGIDDGDFDAWLISRGIDPDTGQPIGDGPISPDDEGGSGGNAADGYEREPEPDELPDEPPARSRRGDDRKMVQQLLAAERRGQRKAMDQLTPILAQQAAQNALRDAGFDGDQDRLNAMLRFIDPDQIDVEVDATGFEVVGVDEQVEELREQFPELFGGGQPTRAARRRATAPDDREPRDDRDRSARNGAGVSRRRSGAREVDGGSGSGRGGRSEPTTWVERAAAQMARRHGG